MRSRPVTRAGVALLLALATVAVSGAVPAPSASAAPGAGAGAGAEAEAEAEPADAAAPARTPVDGLSMETAAASCWEVKQNDPSSRDGVYWLQTPTLVAPEQFYCDQTTDGGGWVLIGRGREGWQYYSEGKGTTAEVRETVTGPAAFDVRQLSADVVDGLLDGGRVDALTDGIRVRRATDQSGTRWQEVRFAYAKDKVTGWTWALGGGIPLSWYSFDGTRRTGGSSSEFGTSGTTSFSTSIQDSRTRYLAGMGMPVTGNPSASSYLWATTTSPFQRAALPFAQMYLRPRLLTPSTSYPAADEAPLPESTVRPLVSDRALPGEWGVRGLANGDPGELSIEVAAFAQVGDVMYVGGNFTHVLKNGDVSTQEAQPYLAAFDASTGEWVPSFRPRLDKQVKALFALPSGELLVGGQFTTVNGAAHTGLVALDPATGEVAASYPIGAYLGTVRDISVKTFVQDGDWLYVGGRFSALWGGSKTRETRVLAGNAGRVNIRTGEPDWSWNPRMTGTVASIATSAAGDRVYLAGFFKKSGTTATDSAAALSTESGSPVRVIPWALQFSHSTHYQQGVVEAGGTVFLGGAQHAIAMYDASTLRRTSSAISLDGGDFQTVVERDGVVYAGNHGVHYIYSGATTYSSSPSRIGPWTDVHKFTFTGAWDAATGRLVPAFDPMLKARRDNGTWAMTFDSAGTLWMGGDFTSAVGANGRSRWVGGFVRFPQRDAVAPATPREPTLQDGVLRWTAASDDRPGAVSYEVVVDGRVRFTTTATEQPLRAFTDARTVVVRTVDAQGNRSASTEPVVQVDPGSVLLTADATWSTAPAPVDGSWRAPGYDDSTWVRGTAPLGHGGAGLATTVPAELTRSFRTTVSVDDPATVAAVRLTTVADDGVAVYVNGHEVVRSALPEGPLTPSTYALTARSSVVAGQDPVVVYVPASYLVPGTNTITAETHLNYRASKDSSFWLTATALDDATGLPVIDGPPEDLAVLRSGTAWTVRHSAGDPEDGWSTLGSAPGDGTETALTPFGYGTSDLATTLPPPERNRPLTTYARTTFVVDDPDATGDLVLTTLADDGVAVYVNGHEVVRSNLPAGPLTSTTYALTARRTPLARSEPVEVVVPRSLLVPGENTVAAEIHVNYRASADMSFDATLSRAQTAPPADG